jgi:hypothetical protein
MSTEVSCIACTTKAAVLIGSQPLCSHHALQHTLTMNGRA